LDFVDAPRVFEGPTFTFEDDRFAYDEQRYLTLASSQGWSFPWFTPNRRRGST